MRVVLLSFCFVLLLFVTAKNRENKSLKPTTATYVAANSNAGFPPNFLRPIGDLLKKLFGTNEENIKDFTNAEPVFDTFTLNRNEIMASCPVEKPLQKQSDNQQTVEVTAHATDIEGDTIIYIYKVSGGRLIYRDGEYRNSNRAIWDLSGVKLSKYSIAVYADDGCGFCGYAPVMEIKVVDNPNCPVTNSAK